MIHFIKDQVPEKADINLSDYQHLNSFSDSVHSLLQDSKLDEVHILMRPPIHPECSIPLAFQRVVKIAERMNKSDLKVNCWIQSGAEDFLVPYLPESSKPRYSLTIGDFPVQIKVGDILDSGSEAIVNPSNKNLRLGGGVSGAIQKAATAQLETELKCIAHSREIKDGDAIVTSAYGVGRGNYLIHIATDTGIPEIVALGIKNAIWRTNEYKISSIAFPAIAAGAGGLKIERLAGIFKEVLAGFEGDSQISYPKELVIYLFKKIEYDRFNDSIVG